MVFSIVPPKPIPQLSRSMQGVCSWIQGFPACRSDDVRTPAQAQRKTPAAGMQPTAGIDSKTRGRKKPEALRGFFRY
jgi:hypothetical protein